MSKGAVACRVMLLATATAAVAGAKHAGACQNTAAMGGLSRGGSIHGIQISRGGAIDDEKVGFFGDFQDELRKMREEMDQESQESMEGLHVLRESQRDNQSVEQPTTLMHTDVGTAKDDTNIGTGREGERERAERVKPQVRVKKEFDVPARDAGHPMRTSRRNMTAKRPSRDKRKEIEYYEESERHEDVVYEEEVKVILKPVKVRPPKRKSLTVTKFSEEVPVTAFSGGANSKTRKPKKPLSKNEKQLKEMKKMVKMELENVEKNLTKNDWRRASVTGVLLMMLCILTTLALRIVEKSLGVP